MELYLLRHAIAVARGTTGIEDDSLRPLTDKGAKKMRRIAQGMLALRFSVDAIYSSPYVRARQTAEIVADAFKPHQRLELTPHLAVAGSPRDLIEHVARARHDSVMLVGHEPYLSALASMLIAGMEHAAITLKKGGLCKLTAPELGYGRCATLEWLLTPRILAAL